MKILISTALVAVIFCGNNTLLAQNRVDELVGAQLSAHNIPPSDQCSPDRLLRRLHLLLTDRIPTAAQAQNYLANPDSENVTDSLLQSEGFVEMLTLKYGDLLRIKSEFPSNLWPNAVQAYNKWLTDHFRAATPYDQMVRELLTGTGSDFRVPATNFYRTGSARTPQIWADNISTLFLGRRTAPQEWYGFFAQVKFKSTTEWKEEILWLDADIRPPFGPVTMPDGTQITLARGTDFRVPFASWLTSQRQFAAAMANRTWFWLMGRGLIDPCDDMRAENPCANPALLDYLTDRFIASDYDIRALVREIVLSQTFSASSLSKPRNVADSLYNSHFAMRRLTAEQLTDALCDITGVPDRYSSRAPEPFTNYPAGTRATQIGDGTVTTAELDLFGRPSRDLALESNRDNSIDAKQVLYLLNSKNIYDKLAQSPVITNIIRESSNSARKIAEDLYIAILGRRASQKEIGAAADWIEQAREKTAATPRKNNAPNPGREAVEAIAWALINSNEFLFIN